MATTYVTQLDDVLTDFLHEFRDSAGIAIHALHGKNSRENYLNLMNYTPKISFYWTNVGTNSNT